VDNGGGFVVAAYLVAALLGLGYTWRLLRRLAQARALLGASADEPGAAP